MRECGNFLCRNQQPREFRSFTRAARLVAKLSCHKIFEFSICFSKNRKKTFFSLSALPCVLTIRLLSELSSLSSSIISTHHISSSSALGEISTANNHFPRCVASFISFRSSVSSNFFFSYFSLSTLSSPT